MISRLHKLQAENAKSSLSPTKNLPQDSQVETTKTSNISTDQQDKTEGEDEGEDAESSRAASNTSSKPLSQLGPALKNGGCSSSTGGSSSTRLLPDFVYQASPVSREMEDRQGGRGGGGRRRAVKENGRKAKQKINFTSFSGKTEEEVERSDASEQPADSTSWSEMSSMVIGSDYSLSPLSLAMEQRLILQYLTPLGDYQDVRLNTKHNTTPFKMNVFVSS